MDIERHITLLALVYSLQPVSSGGVALLAALAMSFSSFIEYTNYQVVVLIIPCVAVVQERVAFEGGRSMDLKHTRRKSK